MGLSYSKFFKYSNLNEISKFSNLNNLFLLSGIESISVWFSLDLSLEKSKPLYYSKSLLCTFLIYLITNEFPVTRTSSNQNKIYIESCLTGLGLKCFLEKFFIIYNSKHRKILLKNFNLNQNTVRFVVTDFNFFTELSGFLNLFSLLDQLHIDIVFNHKEDFRNFLFLNNLFKSSYLV